MNSPSWSTPVAARAPAGLSNITAFTHVGDRLYASSNGGGVAVYGERDGRGWRTLVTDSAASSGLGESLGMQHRFCGQGGGLWGLCVPSARMVAFNTDNASWGVLGEANPTLKLSWALCAYDPSRDFVIVWGPQKRDGKRSDATLVWHGGWHKPKKSTPVAAEDLAADAFCLAYSPRHGGVVRVSKTEAAVFDGRGWQPLQLANAHLLHSWERAPFLCGDTAVLVQRFIKEPSVVRLGGDAKTVTVEKVCAVPSLVQRTPNDPGGNVVADVVGVSEQGVLVGFDAKKNLIATLDFGALLR